MIQALILAVGFTNHLIKKGPNNCQGLLVYYLPLSAIGFTFSYNRL